MVVLRAPSQRASGARSSGGSSGDSAGFAQAAAATVFAHAAEAMLAGATLQSELSKKQSGGISVFFLSSARFAPSGSEQAVIQRAM